MEDVRKDQMEIDKIFKKFRPILPRIQKKTETNESEKIRKKEEIFAESDDCSDHFAYMPESDESDSSDSDEDMDEVIVEDFEKDFFSNRSFDVFLKPISSINAGLVNIGETCYISAALQIIFQIPFLDNIFENPKKNCSEVAHSLVSLYLNAKISDMSIIPIDFITTYEYAYNIKQIKGANDSMECFVRFFDIIESNFNFDFSQYYMIYQQKIICQNGHLFFYEQQKELFYDIFLINNSYDDIQGSIENFFNNYEIKELLCPNENQLIQCKITNYLEKSPLIIFVQFYKYYYNQESQNMEKLQFNLNINDQIEVNSTFYNFKCALLHIGGRESGHYQVIVKNQNDFYLYNDALVTKLDNFHYSDFKEKYELIMYVRT